MASLRNRILEAWPTLSAKTPEELLQSLRKKLFKAFNTGRMGTGSDEIQKWVKLDPPDRDGSKPRPAGEHIVVGGDKDFRRDPTNAWPLRDDGAWLHFSITVRWDGRKQLELIGYNFEIVFPPGHSPSFVRIDLNPPDHDNEERGLRSHMHPGNDDLQTPAPVMTPEEILDLLIWGLRPRDTEKPRA